MSGWIKKMALAYILRRIFTMKILEWLKGKKTYLVAISTIIGAIASYASGTIEVGEMIKIIVAAIMAMTIRAGITKSGINGQ